MKEYSALLVNKDIQANDKPQVYRLNWYFYKL
jgi:hypothetical protein